MTNFKLSLPDFSFSLTEGTNIPPPPPESPPTTIEAARPPTPGYGPLSSHPTTPDHIPGAFPLSPEEEADQKSKELKKTDSEEMAHEHALLEPQSPTSNGTGAYLSPSSTNGEAPPLKRPSNVRKFLSLRSLNILSSKQDQFSPTTSESRPGSPWSVRTTQTEATTASKPSLTRKKSSGWFGSARRKSQMWGMDEAIDVRAELGKENGNGKVERRQSVNGLLNGSGQNGLKRQSSTTLQKESERKGPPPPKLPALEKLGNGIGGGLGGEDLFKNIQ